MSQRKEILAKNIEMIGYDDLNKKPGFQLALYRSGEKYYLYTASFRHNGMNILEVTDPKHPRNVKWWEGPWIDESVRDGQSLPKLQIGDDYLITAHGGTMDILHGTPKGNTLPFWGGIMIWSLKEDPENPKLLGKFQCKGSGGVHRFCYPGGNYVYVVGNCEGFHNFILRIVDISDPANPVEVSKWYDDRQFMLNKSGSDELVLGSYEFLHSPFLHACTYKDDVLYMAYANRGMVMLDVSDKHLPKLIGEIGINPVIGGGSGGAPTHTAYPLGDRPYVVVTTEGERSRYFSNEVTDGPFHKIVTQPMQMIGLVEITDPANPSLISICPYPEVPEGYTHGTNFNIVDGVRVPFGPHNCFDYLAPGQYQKYDNLIFNCHFQAGLRVYDVSDPYVPKEIAYFMPPDPEGENWFDNEEKNLLPGAQVAITEDIVIDDRGYIYITTFQDGMYVLKCTF